MLLRNEFILYATLSGAVAFAIARILGSNKNYSWTFSLMIGAIAIYFIFPVPRTGKNIGELLGSTGMLIQKVYYAAGWLLGSFLISLMFKRRT